MHVIIVRVVAKLDWLNVIPYAHRTPCPFPFQFLWKDRYAPQQCIDSSGFSKLFQVVSSTATHRLLHSQFLRQALIVTQTTSISFTDGRLTSGISTPWMKRFFYCLGHTMGLWILTVFVSQHGSICRYEIRQFGRAGVCICLCMHVWVCAFCNWNVLSEHYQNKVTSKSLLFNRNCNVLASIRSGLWQLLFSICATCKKSRSTPQWSASTGASYRPTHANMHHSDV